MRKLVENNSRKKNIMQTQSHETNCKKNSCKKFFNRFPCFLRLFFNVYSEFFVQFARGFLYFVENPVNVFFYFLNSAEKAQAPWKIKPSLPHNKPCSLEIVQMVYYGTAAHFNSFCNLRAGKRLSLFCSKDNCPEDICRCFAPVNGLEKAQAAANPVEFLFKTLRKRLFNLFHNNLEVVPS